MRRGGQRSGGVTPAGSRKAFEGGGVSARRQGNVSTQLRHTNARTLTKPNLVKRKLMRSVRQTVTRTFMQVNITAARGPRLRVPTTNMTTKQTTATAVALITQSGIISVGASSPRVAFHSTLLRYSANTRLFTAFVPIIPRSTQLHGGMHEKRTGTEEQDRGPREEIGHERTIRVGQVGLRPAVPRKRCTELSERARTCPRK